MISVVDAALTQLTTVGSAFGALEKRIELQNDFATKLHDNITAGIGRLVDADMEEESSRLRALQTQQQLGLQSLNIANATYDTVRQLFERYSWPGSVRELENTRERLAPRPREVYRDK